MDGPTTGPRNWYSHTTTPTTREQLRHMSNEGKRKERRAAQRLHPTSTKALPRGAGLQSLLRENNNHVRNLLATGTSERALVGDNIGPLIVTCGKNDTVCSKRLHANDCGRSRRTLLRRGGRKIYDDGGRRVRICGGYNTPLGYRR